MGSVELPYLATSPKIIFFTDFDGTVTLQDSNDFLTKELGYGETTRRERIAAVLEGKLTFRDAFRDMMDSIKTPFDTCINHLKNKMELDPHFVEFYRWAQANNVPIVVLSSGMVPVIRTLFDTFLGHRTDPFLHIVANDVESRDGRDVNSEGGWKIKFHDDSEFGHDKSIEIKPYAALPEAERPVLLYAGDGVSDFSAASQTDLLFAKEGHELARFCEDKGVPFVKFENWASILATTKDILSGKTTAKEAALSR